MTACCCPPLAVTTCVFILFLVVLHHTMGVTDAPDDGSDPSYLPASPPPPVMPDDSDPTMAGGIAFLFFWIITKVGWAAEHVLGPLSVYKTRTRRLLHMNPMAAFNRQRPRCTACQACSYIPVLLLSPSPPCAEPVLSYPPINTYPISPTSPSLCPGLGMGPFSP